MMYATRLNSGGRYREREREIERERERERRRERERERERGKERERERERERGQELSGYMCAVWFCWVREGWTTFGFEYILNQAILN
jgi:hypothetical protein